MSLIAMALNLLLAALLAVAVTVGVRLNRRLKGLRESQAGFAQAVAELNEAAGRAEAGLTALRSASEEAHDELLKRIETARGLATRLDKLNAEAARLAEARAPADRAAEIRPVEPRSPTARTPTVRPSPQNVPARPATAKPATARPETARPETARPGAAARAWAAFDDDLFEAPGGEDLAGLELGPLTRTPATPPRRTKGEFR